MGILETLVLVLLVWVVCGWIGMIIARVGNALKTDQGKNEINFDVFIVFTGLGPIALIIVILTLVLKP